MPTTNTNLKKFLNTHTHTQKEKGNKSMGFKTKNILFRPKITFWPKNDGQTHAHTPTIHPHNVKCSLYVAKQTHAQI